MTGVQTCALPISWIETALSVDALRAYFAHVLAGGRDGPVSRWRLTGSEIGRAPCRERVWQSVEISVVAEAFKKKTCSTQRLMPQSMMRVNRNYHRIHLTTRN